MLLPLAIVLGAIPAPVQVQAPLSDPLPKALPVVCTIDEPLTAWCVLIKRKLGGAEGGCGFEGGEGGEGGDGGGGKGGGGVVQIFQPECTME